MSTTTEIVELDHSPTARLLALWILGHGGEAGPISVMDLSFALHLSHNTVLRAVSELNDAGVISVHRERKRMPATYKLMEISHAK